MDLSAIKSVDGGCVVEDSPVADTLFHMEKPLIIAGIYPCAKGLGYAVFQGADYPLDYGSPAIPSKERERFLKRAVSILEGWKPDIIALRVEHQGMVSESKAMEGILKDIREVAQNLDIQVAEYSRGDIREAFEVFGTHTRDDIARKICEWFPSLAECLPPRRGLGDAQHYRMPMFDAIALVCAHYHFSS